MLEIAGLTVVRRQMRGADKTVLEDIDFRVDPGEVVMLIGPNGAGKSTLLAAVSGDLAPASGQVRFESREVAAWDAKSLARRRAVLPQRPGLSLPFLVEEVVRLGCLARTESRGALDRLVAAAMVGAGVDHLQGRVLPALSGGEQSRVHLARVLAQIWPADDAPGTARQAARNLLLLDEPCASLDPHHQHAVCGIVRDFARRTGTGVVVTMHDMNLAAQYGDRIVALRDGRVVAEGAPRDVLGRAFVQSCFGVDAAHMTEQGAMLVATRPLDGHA